MRKYIIAGLIFFVFVLIACGGRGQSTTDSPEVKYTLANKINYGHFAEPEVTNVILEFDTKSINLQKGQCLSLSKSQFDSLKITWRGLIVCNNTQGEKKCPSPGHYKLQAAGSTTWKTEGNIPKFVELEAGAANCLELK